MKKIILAAVASLSLLEACHKDRAIEPGLTGKWELRSSGGGFTGYYKNYNPGNGNILQFTTSNTYKQYEKFKLTNQGSYTIKKIPPVSGAVEVDSIYFSTGWADQIQVNRTKLILGTGIADGIVSQYEKIGQ